MWAMVQKEFRQLRRDHRTVAMMVVLPLVLLVVFGYAASFDVTEIKTVVVGPDAQAAADRLRAPFVVDRVEPASTREDAVATLRDGYATVAIVTGGQPQALIDGADLFAARAAVTALRQAAAQAPQEVPEPEVLFNPGLETSVIMVPALIGVILVFVGTVATSLGVVRERQAGTLEQLAVMPFRPADVFVGKILPYFLIAAIDLTVITIVGITLFDVPFRGSVLTLALGATLFLFVTLGLGVLISTVSQNQGQAIQLAIMTLLPQVLLSGMLFPLQSMAAGVRWIGYVLPLTYFIQVSRGVMVRGTPIQALVLPLSMLAVLGLAVSIVSVVRFRRDLAPGGRARARAPEQPTTVPAGAR
jgi:ABC-type multidrug transport system permease subunit